MSAFLGCTLWEKPGFPGIYPPTGPILPPTRGKFPVTPSSPAGDSPGTFRPRSPMGQLWFPWPLPAGQAFLWLLSKVLDRLLEK